MRKAAGKRIESRDIKGIGVKGDRSTMDDVRAKFDVKNVEAVGRFLEKQPGLIPALLEAGEAIKEYFPDNPKAKLSYETDPDIKGFESLFVSIPYSDDVQHAYAKLTRFSEGWLYPRYKTFKGAVGFDLDFA